MASLTTYSKDLVLAWLLTAGTATRPTAWYVALHTGDPGAAGTANEVVVGTDADYVRKAVTFAAPSGGQDLSSTQVSWTAASDATTHVVTHGSIWTADTGGSCLLQAALLASHSRPANDVFTIPIGDIIAAAS